MSTATLDEEELITLIARCALRDKKALKSLYDKTSAYLNAIAYRIVRSPELCSDVLQEAYLQIWRNAATYRPEQAKAMTWMSSTSWSRSKSCQVRMNVVAAMHFNRGQRAFFFALGYLGWFVSPWVLFVTTAAVVIVTWRRQFASNAWRAMGK